MFRKFVDRVREIDALEERWSAHGAQLVIIYGRRRVGKTELIRKFLEGKPSLYYLADASPLERQLERFLGLMEEKLRLLVPRGVASWADGLAFAAKAGRLVLALDEFGYLVQRDPGILAEVQRAWDETLRGSQVFLVLCGSAVSVMETHVLGARSPLYGRRTSQWRLEPMEFWETGPFFPRYEPEELARVYMTLGGVPGYLEKFDGSLSFFKNVEERMLRRGEFLYDEPEFLMRAELREPHSYFPIVEAIAQGRTRLNEISGHSKIEVRSLPKYLSVLEGLGVVEKVTPVAERRLRTRRYLYRVRDPLFASWFRYVYPNRGLLEMGETRAALDLVKKDFDNYAGTRFVSIAVQLALKTVSRTGIAEYGPWWLGGDEIDLVLLQRDGGRYTRGLFYEVKWGDLGLGEARRELGRLSERVEAFPVRLRDRRLGLVARRIEGARVLEREGYLVSDLHGSPKNLSE